jgi:hypothetical protein
MIPNLHGGVLNACKGERIHNYIIYANLEIVALKVQLDLLDNVGIIKVEKHHNPIKGQKLLCKIENKHNVVFTTPILEVGNV